MKMHGYFKIFAILFCCYLFKANRKHRRLDEGMNTVCAWAAATPFALRLPSLTKDDMVKSILKIK
ncbi:hypothetical protein TUM4637_06100 [Shewanella hafniensis]|nr:hypothetical protein TUM4637_06100 [Shewanella hafniensis]